MSKLTTITTIPLELLVTIFVYLPTTSLLNCTRVSRFFRDTIASSIALQYSLAKDKAGVEDSLDSENVPLATRLTQLHRREAAWKNFEYAFRRTVLVGNLSTEIYDVTRCAYFLGTGTRAGDAHGVQYARLPREMDEEVSWREITAGSLVAEFSVSNESDLVALLCYSTTYPPEFDIQLRRFSDGARHPEATNPIIHVCDVKVDAGPPSIAINICGSTLVLGIDYPNSFDYHTLMYVYNWRTGMMFTSKPIEVPFFSIGVVFLREDIFVLPISVRHVLNVYAVPLSLDPLCPPDTLRPIVALELPRPNEWMIFTSFACRSDPSPQGSPVCPPSPLARSNGSTYTTRLNGKLPFQNRSEDALLLFTIDTSHHLDPGRIIESFSFVVHRDSILKLVLPHHPSFKSSCTNIKKGQGDHIINFDLSGFGPWHHRVTIPHIPCIEWAAWGYLTRWFCCATPTLFITATSGCRYVRINEGSVELFDFGRERVRDCMAMSCGKGEENSEGSEKMKRSWTLISDSTRMKTESFEEDIITSLPYILTRSEEKLGWKEVMMDEERIIGIKDDTEVKEIDVLYFG